MSPLGSQSEMNVMEAIQKRRSIRRFRPDAIPESVLTELLEAARLAPSGSNLQPWRFMVITDSKQIADIGQMALNQKVFRDAPAVIVCCGDMSCFAENNRSARYEELNTLGIYDEIGIPTEYIRSTMDKGTIIPENIPTVFLNVAIATEHIVLYATSLGLGTLWIGALNRKEVAKYIGLPEDMVIVALLLVGVPAQDPPPRPRLSLDKIILPAPKSS